MPGLLESGARRLGGRPSAELPRRAGVPGSRASTAAAISLGGPLDRADLDLAVRALLETVAARIEGEVADLLVHADRFHDLAGGQPLATAEPGLDLGSAGTGAQAELVVDVRGRTHRADRNMRLDRLSNRAAECRRVLDRDRESPVAFAEAASIEGLVATVSTVSGARYSTGTP